MLELEPHPSEGGYFVETYRSKEAVEPEALPERYGAARSFGTAIYYMLTPETFSEMHRLKSDEVFHFYLGDPVEMLQLRPDGSGKVVILGSDVVEGMRPQFMAPREVWQGIRLRPRGKFALMGCTVAPGFDYADYESGTRAALAEAYPDYSELIAQLTR